MPSILNSDDGVVSGTSGLKSTGGNDGLLNIQSNGSTIVAVTGSGISVTGTVSQTGVSTFAAGTVSAPSITFTGDTNTGIFSPAADTIAFTEGGVEAMRIDSSGNVGIGVTSPDGLLTFSGAQSNTPKVRWQNSTVDADAALSTFQDSNGTNLYIGSNFYCDSGGSNARFATGTPSAGILVDGRNGVLQFLTNTSSGVASERARIPAAGGFQCVNSISVGNATPTTSGAGITFPATQSASSNANTLDDYEEGTWTPAFSTTGNAFSSITYTIQTGYYTKIGNMVYIWGYLLINTVSGGTGNITVTGLPFTNGSMQGGVTTNWADGQWTTRCPDAGHILTNSTTIYVIQYGGTQTLQIPVGNAKAVSQWIFDGAYGIV